MIGRQLREGKGQKLVCRTATAPLLEIDQVKFITSTRQMRKSRAKSCSNCREAKARCSQLNPCARCQRRGITCSYPVAPSVTPGRHHLRDLRPGYEHQTNEISYSSNIQIGSIEFPTGRIQPDEDSPGLLAPEARNNVLRSEQPCRANGHSPVHQEPEKVSQISDQDNIPSSGCEEAHTVNPAHMMSGSASTGPQLTQRGRSLGQGSLTARMLLSRLAEYTRMIGDLKRLPPFIHPPCLSQRMHTCLSGLPHQCLPVALSRCARQANAFHTVDSKPKLDVIWLAICDHLQSMRSEV